MRVLEEHIQELHFKRKKAEREIAVIDRTLVLLKAVKTAGKCVIPMPHGYLTMEFKDPIYHNSQGESNIYHHVYDAASRSIPYVEGQ